MSALPKDGLPPLLASVAALQPVPIFERAPRPPVVLGA